MKTGDECDPNFLTFVLRLRENPGKNLNQEIDPTGDRTRARCVKSNDVILDHSGGPGDRAGHGTGSLLPIK